MPTAAVCLPPCRCGPNLTVTFVAQKLGLLTGPAVDYAGEVIHADLGIPAQAYGEGGVRVLGGEALPRLKRARNAHKGDFGRLLIVGGEADMGAVRRCWLAKPLCAPVRAWSALPREPSIEPGSWRAGRN